MSYFLLAVSTRENLDLCIRHALAGFPNSISGLWAFLDIQEGDYVSLLYGARAHNLYRVAGKAAYREAQSLPPWPLLTHRPSGRTYYFPFRLQLEPVRTLDEALVRAEFAYVAENLLLRGGYRRSHFQADQTTLQSVSQMGMSSTSRFERLEIPGATTFTPALAKSRTQPPEVFPLRELLVQAALRRYLSLADRLADFLERAGIRSLEASNLEVLGEKALPEGHVDLLIKETTPMGVSPKVLVEVKLGRAAGADVRQLSAYTERLGEECAGRVLVASAFGERIRAQAMDSGIACAEYTLANLDGAPVPHLKFFDSLALSWAPLNPRPLQPQ